MHIYGWSWSIIVAVVVVVHIVVAVAAHFWQQQRLMCVVQRRQAKRKINDVGDYFSSLSAELFLYLLPSSLSLLPFTLSLSLSLLCSLFQQPFWPSISGASSRQQAGCHIVWLVHSFIHSFVHTQHIVTIYQLGIASSSRGVRESLLESSIYKFSNILLRYDNFQCW